MSSSQRTARATPFLACPDCGLSQHLPTPRRGFTAECHRCRRPLARARLLSREATLALLTTTLLLWCPASTATLMRVASAGAVRTGGIASGVQALWVSGFGPLALVVALFALIVPWIYLGLITWVLWAVRASPPHPSLVACALRWAQRLRPWMMIEVFLLGGCVAYSRIEQVAFVEVGLGGWCLVAMTLLLLLGLAELDLHGLWEALSPIPAPPASAARGAPDEGNGARSGLACLECEALVGDAQPGDHCPRCHAILHPRKPHAVQRTAALALCGLLLYFPANLLPVLSLERLGHAERRTILGGVRELAASGLWPLALLVFVASIVIPLAKLLVLGSNLWLLGRGSARALVLRTRLHRAVDAVGRWSNIDIFMLSLLVSLVQFGALTHVRAEDGATAFAAVVIVTMLAARVFDPRLMWDAAGTPR